MYSMMHPWDLFGKTREHEYADNIVLSDFDANNSSRRGVLEKILVLSLAACAEKFIHIYCYLTKLFRK